MSDLKSLVFVVQSPGRESLDWTAIGSTFQIVLTRNPCAVVPAIRALSSSPQREINAVIFDRSITPLEFLDFLSGLDHNFLGDAVLVSDDGSAYLSSVASHTGRFIYKLDADDLQFYAEARFGLEGARASGMSRDIAMTA